MLSKASKSGDFRRKSGHFWSKNRVGSGLGAQLGPKRRPDRVQRGLGGPKFARRRRTGPPRRRQDGPRRPQGGLLGGSWGQFWGKTGGKLGQNGCQDKKIQETAKKAKTLKTTLVFKFLFCDFWVSERLNISKN